MDNLCNWVHVDENWFYILKDGKGVYLHPTEPLPKKTPQAQNKNFIPKLMFLVAVAHPAVGGNIVIETQPANSPDLNVNDLGFFHSI
ncbi:unnamed protein product [Discosporangium mesarthrocarpum]